MFFVKTETQRKGSFTIYQQKTKNLKVSQAVIKITKDKKRTLRNKPKKQHINLQKFTRTEILIYNLKSLTSLQCRSLSPIQKIFMQNQKCTHVVIRNKSAACFVLDFLLLAALLTSSRARKIQVGKLASFFSPRRQCP